MAAPIVDLGSVKAHLNMSITDVSQDDELLGFMQAASEMARDVVGPLMPEEHTQWCDGGRSTIVPDWLPLTSVANPDMSPRSLIPVAWVLTAAATLMEIGVNLLVRMS